MALVIRFSLRPRGGIPGSGVLPGARTTPGVEPVSDSFLGLVIEKAGTLRAGVTFL